MKPCRRCGGAVVGHFNTRFCGDECRQEFKREYIKTWKADHKPPPKPPKSDPIDPFPADIDRRGFGDWLSGFFDGEGTFGLRSLNCKSRERPSFTAYIRITLRDDDIETIRLIRSFWGCGRIYFADNARSTIANANPVAIYSVHRVADLTGIVLPHFDRHPLRAKKRHDLAVWRQGVELMAEIQERPREYRPTGGLMPRWTAAEKERFGALSAELVAQRRYAAPLDLTPARNSWRETP